MSAPEESSSFQAVCAAHRELRRVVSAQNRELREAAERLASWSRRSPKVAEPPPIQVKLRERHAFVSARLADMERQAPYAGQDTEALQAQRDTGELERETKRLELDAALSNRGPNSALARKLTRELDEITTREAGLREELSVRAMQEVSIELALHRARVHAERELRAEDEAALLGSGGLETGQGHRGAAVLVR